MNESFDRSFESGVVSNMLDAGTTIDFSCLKRIYLFNAYYRRADVTLTPYDIIRRKQCLGETGSEFHQEETVPFEIDVNKVAAVKMKTDEGGACLR